MKKIGLIAAFISALFVHSINAQEYERIGAVVPPAYVEVVESIEGDDITFTGYIHNGYGTYTIQLMTGDFTGKKLSFNPAVKMMLSDDSSYMLFELKETAELFTIKGTAETEPTRIRFTYNWIQGKIDPNIDEGFVYRLPFSDKRISTAKTITNSEIGLMHGNFINFTMWEFSLMKGDIIYPSRAGRVISTIGFSPNNNPNYKDNNLFNTITIEHLDGTIAEYSLLDLNSLSVKIGDIVYPDTPIAKAGALSDYEYGVRVRMYYYRTNKHPRFENMFAQTVYINPIFATLHGNMQLSSGKELAPKVTKSLIKKEKSKKINW